MGIELTNPKPKSHILYELSQPGGLLLHFEKRQTGSLPPTTLSALSSTLSYKENQGGVNSATNFKHNKLDQVASGGVHRGRKEEGVVRGWGQQDYYVKIVIAGEEE